MSFAEIQASVTNTGIGIKPLLSAYHYDFTLTASRLEHVCRKSKSKHKNLESEFARVTIYLAHEVMLSEDCLLSVDWIKHRESVFIVRDFKLRNFTRNMQVKRLDAAAQNLCIYFVRISHFLESKAHETKNSTNIANTYRCNFFKV